MPRVPDLPCADCGKLMWRGSGSLQDGQARCLPCRRANPAHGASCPTCGGPVSKRGRNCWSCHAAAVHVTRAARLADTGECIVCGCEFPLYRDKGNGKGLEGPRVCCSLTCGRKRNGIVNRKTKKPGPPYLLTCIGCAVQFTAMRQRMFCTKVCCAQAARVRARAAAKPQLVTSTCKQCGLSFAYERHGAPRAYCSAECVKRTKRTHRDASRARKRAAYVADVSRAYIYERDNWTCHLCGKRVAKAKVVPHPRAPVLDHIIPLARGGTHEPKNVACAHFMCNSIKGARAMGEQLALMG